MVSWPYRHNQGATCNTSNAHARTEGASTKGHFLFKDTQCFFRLEGRERLGGEATEGEWTAKLSEGEDGFGASGLVFVFGSSLFIYLLGQQFGDIKSDLTFRLECDITSR